MREVAHVALNKGFS